MTDISSLIFNKRVAFGMFLLGPWNRPKEKCPLPAASLQWGTRGKSGREPLKFVLLGDCTSNHLQVILDTQFGIGETYRSCIESILAWRDEKPYSRHFFD